MKQVGEVSPKVGTYNRILKACAKVGDIESAKRMFKHMIDVNKITPDDCSWTTLCHCAKSAGDLYFAETILQKWLATMSSLKPHELSKVDPYLFNHLIEAYRRKQEVQAAENIFNRISKSGLRPSAYSYYLMILIAGDHQDFARLEHYLRLMLERNVKIDGHCWKTIAVFISIQLYLSFL